jgi:hypothetical protein
MKETLMTNIKLALLADPFPIQAVCFERGPVNAAATRCQAVPYIDALHLCCRLDAVVGFDRWGERYQTLADGTYRCGITLHLNGRWLTRWSRLHPDPFAEQPNLGPYDDFTEAGLKWGLGRYLTTLPPIWVEAQTTPTEHSLPHVTRFDQFSARAQLARMLADTGQLTASPHGQTGCPTCEKKQQILFDIEELHITLNHHGDCLTLDWPAIRTFSVEKLVIFHAGLKTRRQMLFEDTTPPHRKPSKARTPTKQLT